MKKLYCLVVVFIIFLYGFTAQHVKETAFYVSLSGNDSNPGTKEKPFATFERARDAIRALKEADPLPAGGITVYVRGGIYMMSETFTLTSEDSGTGNSPITWRGFPGEKVQLIGGKVLTGFEPINDPAVLDRIDKAYRDKIMKTGLRAQGITNYEGFGMELFMKGKYMTVARYPNEGWLKIADVPQSGEKLLHPGLDRDIARGRPIPRGKHYGRFKYDGDRPECWAENDDIWMQGFWVWDWSFRYQKVEEIDTKTKEIYPAEPYHNYGYLKGQRFYFLNILEELDSPGEWYLDRKSGVLYFWPPTSLNEDKVFVSIMEDPIISLENTEYVKIRGIHFECSRGNAVTTKEGNNNLIAGCTFTNLGNTAVIIDGGTENGITGCDVYEVSTHGISVSGGDRKTLTPAGNFATNNHVHHFSRKTKTGTLAISILGVGNLMSHNYMHDAPHNAFNCTGNEHIMEFNEIYNVITETGDAGAIHIGRDWTQRGNIIRHNYFHDIHGPRVFGGPGFFEAVAVYLDDTYSGATVYGNVFYDVKMGFLLGGGHDNIFENNVLVKCELSLHIDSRGKGWADYLIVPGGQWGMYKKLEDTNYKNPPYSTKYPKLATILEDGDPHLATGNIIARNISYGEQWLKLYNGLDFSIVSMKDNLIADKVICLWDKKNDGKFVTYKNGDMEIMDELEKYNNMVIDVDPGFMDIDNEDFRLKDDSPAWKIGFKPIPIEKIGLYIDEYRTSLPE